MRKGLPSYGQNGQLLQSWGTGSLWPLQWAPPRHIFQLLTNVWLPRVFSEMVTERGSMVKVPVKMRLFSSSSSLLRPSLHSALPIPLSLVVRFFNVCVTNFLAWCSERTKIAREIQWNKPKINKFRYERIVVKCLLLANLGNWTHVVLDLLWCQSWQFVAGIFILAFFFCCCELSCNFTKALLEWLVMFPAVLANFAQVLLEWLVMFPVVLANFAQVLLEWLVMFPVVLANFAQVLLQLWCCQSWHFYAGSARFVVLSVLAISRTHCWNCDVA